MCGAFGFDRAYASDDSDCLQAASCNVSLATKVVKKKPLSQQKVLITMAGGDVTTLEAKPTGSKVKWATSNKKVAKVKATGKYSVKITAVKPGKATVTAKRDGQTLTCKIVVTGALNKTKATLTPFKTAQLKLKGATAKKWATSNKKVVKVSKGKITPVATGTATVTCTDKKGYKYTCAVTVKCPSITCKMAQSAPELVDSNQLFFKRFTLSNKSGKSLVLNTNAIFYYPDGVDSNRYALAGFNPTACAYFDSAPVTVANAQDYSFWGGGSAYSSVTEKGVFTLGFKVGKAQYRGVFYNSGEMAACMRA